MPFGTTFTRYTVFPLNSRLFFDHLGTILLMAVVGTIFNMLTVGAYERGELLYEYCTDIAGLRNPITS